MYRQLVAMFVGKTVLVAVLLIIFSSVGVRAHANAGTNLDATRIIELSNNARQEQQLPPLAANDRLSAAAQAKAQALVDRGEFAHILQDGTTPWSMIRAAGYCYQSSGENLAVHFKTSKSVVDAWLNSPGHRANMLATKFEDIGIGIAKGSWDGHRGYFIVQLFGTESDRNYCG